MSENKIAFMFSGQGAEKVGMCQDLYNNFEIVKDTFDVASKSLGFDLCKICFGDEEKLKDTSYAQPALVTASISILNILKENGIKADYHLGLSLGEYSAYVASSSLKFEDAVKLVHKRGQLMKESFDGLNCGMTAVLNTSLEDISSAVEKAKAYGILEVANYNSPNQTVISGEINALEKAEEFFSENKNKFIRLGVKGAFHTSLLENASIKLKEELDKIDFKDLETPVVTNVDASLISDKNKIKDILTNQIKSSVYFEQSIRNLIDLGVNTFVEIGTGKTLTSFVKKIDKSVTTYNIEDTSTLNNALEILKK